MKNVYDEENRIHMLAKKRIAKLKKGKRKRDTILIAASILTLITLMLLGHFW